MKDFKSALMFFTIDVLLLVSIVLLWKACY